MAHREMSTFLSVFPLLVGKLRNADKIFESDEYKLMKNLRKLNQIYCQITVSVKDINEAKHAYHEAFNHRLRLTSMNAPANAKANARRNAPRNVQSDNASEGERGTATEDQNETMDTDDYHPFPVPNEGDIYEPGIIPKGAEQPFSSKPFLQLTDINAI